MDLNVNMLTRASLVELRQFLRVVILFWVALWIMVFPLIHVHPETHHPQGSDHHQHGGVAHSIFSQDLPCEFGNDTHDSSREKAHLVGFPDAAHSHSHHLPHSEITFSALNPSSDGPLKKQFMESLVVANQNPPQSYGLTCEKVFHQKEDSASYHFISPYISRPPPVFTI